MKGKVRVEHSALKATLEELQETDPREAAEFALALALACAKQHDVTRARDYARQAEELLAKCPTNTLAECATHHVELDGILLPTLVYPDVPQRVVAEALQ
jgi:hypothetical protein